MLVTQMEKIKMKSMHFCTPKLVKAILDPMSFTNISIRTGWILGVFKGDLVKANWRRYETEWDYKTPHHDEFIGLIKIQSVSPVYFREICKMQYAEEIERYNRKFHPYQWFFYIAFSNFLGRWADDQNHRSEYREILKDKKIFPLP